MSTPTIPTYTAPMLTFYDWDQEWQVRFREEFPDATRREMDDDTPLRGRQKQYLTELEQAARLEMLIYPDALDSMYQVYLDLWGEGGRGTFAAFLARYPESLPEGYQSPFVREVQRREAEEAKREAANKRRRENRAAKKNPEAAERAANAPTLLEVFGMRWAGGAE